MWSPHDSNKLLQVNPSLSSMASFRLFQIHSHPIGFDVTIDWLKNPKSTNWFFQRNYDQANIRNWTIWANRGEWMMISVYLDQIQWLSIHPFLGIGFFGKASHFVWNEIIYVYEKPNIIWPRVKQRLWIFLLVNWFCVNSGDKDRNSGDKWGWAKSNQAQLYFSGKGVHSSVDAFCTHRNIYRKRLR